MARYPLGNCGGLLSDRIAYYEVAAQIIPVLMLALLIERGLFRRSAQETAAQSIWIIGTLGLLLLGELVCLEAVRDQAEPSKFERLIVLGAISLALIALVLVPIILRIRALLDQLPPVLAVITEVVLFIALFVVLGLATYDVISGDALVVIFAGALFAAMIAGRIAEIALRARGLTSPPSLKKRD